MGRKAVLGFVAAMGMALLVSSCQESGKETAKAKEPVPAPVESKAAPAAGTEAAKAPERAPEPEKGEKTDWEWCGWSGGGYYWCAAFDPAQDGTIYMGGDVDGVYKTEDHGRHWRLVNDGLVNYGVYSLAVDRRNPQTVYAATEGGLCKSEDGGAHWLTLPNTGPKELRITGEKGRSVRAIAVDPNDGNAVYAGTPAGRICKSEDGGKTWRQVYQVASPEAAEEAPADALRVQFGGVSAAFHGGIWLPLKWPADAGAKDCRGFGFTFKGSGPAPKTALVSLRTSDGAKYNSRNLRALFEKDGWQDAWLAGSDFSLDSGEARKEPEKAKSWQKEPDWRNVVRMDFCCVNMDNAKPSAALLGELYFAPDGQAGKASRLVVRDFAKDKACSVYSNAKTGSQAPPKLGTVFSVAVAAKAPGMVIGATEQAGVVMSEDGGKTWQELKTPKKATSVAIAESDPNVIFGAFSTEGIWKSCDRGKTWEKSSAGLKEGCDMLEVAVSPANAQDVCAIGRVKGTWIGCFAVSNDGGGTWKMVDRFACDPEGSPTKAGGLSRTSNLAVNPLNPKELFISGNWRAWLSEDGGQSWTERDHGADISCIYDIRFQGPRAYASAMDEGVFVSEDGGKNWRQIWQTKYDAQLSGHSWRLLVGDKQGKDRVLATCSPWNPSLPNYVIVSEDGGASFQVVRDGLPNYSPTVNTMWGRSYPRALAADPANPNIIYLGMDGNATEGKSGGGVFKSEDGGKTWRQLANQPGSRRMFFGLAVDPTDSKRLYWGACGENGGLWRSEDGGESWQRVFKNGEWVFNVLVAPDGTVYCPEKNLWASKDHGATWRQLTRFEGDASIVALEIDPANPKTLWMSKATWGGKTAFCGVFKSVDGGESWREITGNLPYRKPMVLRYNPETKELWAAGVGAFKSRQE